MNRRIEQLNSLISGKIPVAAGMGIHILEFDGTSLSIALPLKPNANDKGTAFAGSIYSALVLSGWCLITAALAEAGLNTEVVIAESDVKFKRPVSGDSVATATFDGPFSPDTLAREGRQTIRISARIMCDGKTAAEMTGTYVAKKKLTMDN